MKRPTNRRVPNRRERVPNLVCEQVPLPYEVKHSTAVVRFLRHKSQLEISARLLKT